jgi:hypothetical protein
MAGSCELQSKKVGSKVANDLSSGYCETRMNIGDDSSTESVAGDEMYWGMKGISKRKMYILKDGTQAQPSG